MGEPIASAMGRFANLAGGSVPSDSENSDQVERGDRGESQEQGFEELLRDPADEGAAAEDADGNGREEQRIEEERGAVDEA